MLSDRFEFIQKILFTKKNFIQFIYKKNLELLQNLNLLSTAIIRNLKRIICSTWFPLRSINSSLVHRLVSLPFYCEHQKLFALNSSPKIKGDELAMKYQKVLLFIAGSSFICDLMITVSNIKEILPILADSSEAVSQRCYVKKLFLETLQYSQEYTCARVSFLKSLEAVVERCFVKKVFLEVSQNSQKNTCARVSFINKDAGLRAATLLKKRLWYWSFPVKFLRTPFLTEHLWWLLLKVAGLRPATLLKKRLWYRC